MVSSVTGYSSATYALLNAAGSANNTATTAASAYGQSSAAAKTSGSNVNVTLSAEAKAALAAQTDSRTTDAVVASARSAIDKLLSDAKASSALKDGKPTIDLSGLDRRTLYAIASNKGGKFPIEEQVVAALQMKSTREAALATPAAATRVTGDYAGLYKAYLAQLDAAGPEEKAAAQWARDRAAVAEGLKQATDKPGVAPKVDGDPVAAYLKDSGGVVASPRTRDIKAVASDVRAVLDKQYAAATGEGMARDKDSGKIDFSRFDDRSLAAVALNKGEQFSDHEIAQAAAEVKARSRDSVSNAYKSTAGTGDASAFGKSLITQYASMSDEERQASGWTPALYDKMVALQNLSEKLASLFNSDGSVNTGGTSLLDYI
ncbi:MAG: hypothetical protein J7521_11390 [Caulobacter sp.]|nr:hypothetical protein [Caulobacter sp.]